ncbi:MAG TPA: hypothetical protein VIK83_05150 [Coriobacteriia bacterium]
MKRSTLALSALIVVLAVVTVGCGSPGAAKPSGATGATGATGGSGGASGSAPYYIEKPYPTIVPSSPNEKKAAASTATALKTYITGAELGNKQNKRTDPIFDNKQGYKPRFVGYGFVILSAKSPQGKYLTLDVAAFDGGAQVKPLSVWERFGSVTKGDGVMNDSYYAGVATTFDPAQMTPAYTPVSAGEKAAQAAVEAWAKKNLDPSLSTVRLATYLFQWGEREDRPNMMMSITPGGFSYNSAISWGPTK